MTIFAFWCEIVLKESLNFVKYILRILLNNKWKTTNFCMDENNYKK